MHIYVYTYTNFIYLEDQCTHSFILPETYNRYIVKLVVNFRAVTDDDIEDIDELPDELVCESRDKKTE